MLRLYTLTSSRCAYEVVFTKNNGFQLQVAENGGPLHWTYTLYIEIIKLNIKLLNNKTLRNLLLTWTTLWICFIATQKAVTTAEMIAKWESCLNDSSNQPKPLTSEFPWKRGDLQTLRASSGLPSHHSHLQAGQTHGMETGLQTWLLQTKERQASRNLTGNIPKSSTKNLEINTKENLNLNGIPGRLQERIWL